MEALMMEQSETLGALAKALVAAQADLHDAKKDASNPGFKGSRYASLAAVREAVVMPLAKHGLAVLQTNEPHGDAGVCVVTTLLHESGEWIRGKLFLPVSKKDAQGFGSALTYARRYSLAEIAGIASDDDDDANGATGRTPLAKPSEPATEMDHSKEAEAMLATLFDAAKTVDDLAKVTQQTSDAVKAKALSDAARNRLRKKMSEAQSRISPS